MTRRLWLATMALGALGKPVQAISADGQGPALWKAENAPREPAEPVKGRALRGLHIQGPLRATDQEAQEGYFSVGNNVVLIARQNSDEHQALRGMLGQDVNLSVF